MKDIHLIEVNNGYDVILEDDCGRKSTYVYKANELLTMIEFVGKLVNGKRVYVKD